MAKKGKNVEVADKIAEALAPVPPRPVVKRRGKIKDTDFKLKAGGPMTAAPMDRI